MSKIKNTKADADANPQAYLKMISLPGFVEAQEAQGQRELAAGDVLPTAGSEDPAWEQMGVVFGPLCPDDPLFREVSLPAGWKLVPREDHDMWSTLVDDRGRKRASVFYKAAFYDRRAKLHPLSRFSLRLDLDDDYNVRAETVVDGEKVIFSSPPLGGGEEWRRDAKARDACIKWLEDRYPEWQDVTKYWELP